MIIDFYLNNKLFSSFYSFYVFLQTLGIKSRNIYIYIIGPKDRWTNMVFFKLKQILEKNLDCFEG